MNWFRQEYRPITITAIGSLSLGFIFIGASIFFQEVIFYQDIIKAFVIGIIFGALFFAPFAWASSPKKANSENTETTIQRRHLAKKIGEYLYIPYLVSVGYCIACFLNDIHNWSLTFSMIITIFSAYAGCVLNARPEHLEKKAIESSF